MKTKRPPVPDALEGPQAVPAHHWPQTQGLELMTDPAVTDACTLAVQGMSDCWERFFARALELGERVKQRRALRTPVPSSCGAGVPAALIVSHVVGEPEPRLYEADALAQAARPDAASSPTEANTSYQAGKPCA